MGRALAVAFALTGALVAWGCGSDQPEAMPSAPATTEPSATTTEAETTTESAPKPLAGLPGFTAGYLNWTKLNAKPVPPRESGDAHLGTKNVFASREMGANGRFPNGTIIVKEANRPGKDFIGLIATMRKQKGADPEHNDWVFVEYAREGANERFSELASGAVCSGCHVNAAGADYVWVIELGLAK